MTTLLLALTASISRSCRYHVVYQKVASRSLYPRAIILTYGVLCFRTLSHDLVHTSREVRNGVVCGLKIIEIYRDLAVFQEEFE